MAETLNIGALLVYVNRYGDIKTIELKTDEGRIENYEWKAYVTPGEDCFILDVLWGGDSERFLNGDFESEPFISSQWRLQATCGLTHLEYFYRINAIHEYERIPQSAYRRAGEPIVLVLMN